MPKRRRKLSPELEKKISLAKKKQELIMAIINDIEEEEIQGEYRSAFDPVRLALAYLSELYDSEGFNLKSEQAWNSYTESIKSFESEYEI